MSFPTTSVLTTFTGADESPLSEGGNWTSTDVVGGTARLQRVSNQCSAAASGGGSQVWNTSFAAAQEVYITIVSNSAGVNLYARLANINTSSLNGYIFQYDGGTNIYIYRCTNAAVTQLATAVVSFGNGDQMGFGLSGNILTGYKNGTSVVSYDITPDSTKYTGAGYTGLFAANNTILLDSYGGGAFVGAPVNTVAPAASVSGGTGFATKGQTLTTTTGTWTGDISSGATYQWQRDNSGGASYSNIGSATASTYALVSADVGCNVRCVVTETGTGGATAANSNALGLVGPLTTTTQSIRVEVCANQGDLFSILTAAGSFQLLGVGV